ncbi:MAG: DUF721 domain-containing protein [Bacteroidetes bacterium]|nr:DUF721 domain-containing protein [Bacteroidota bacterium]
MRRKYPTFIGSLIKELKTESSLSDGMKEIAVLGSWNTVVGNNIANYTTKIYIRNRKLFVHFSSAVARNEVFARRVEILRQLNEKTGERYITFISIF